MPSQDKLNTKANGKSDKIILTKFKEQFSLAAE